MGRKESKGLASRDSKSLRMLGTKKSQKKDHPVQVFKAPQVCQVLGGSTQGRTCHKVQWVMSDTDKGRAIEERGFTLILLVLLAFNASDDDHHLLLLESSLIIKRAGCRNGSDL